MPVSKIPLSTTLKEYLVSTYKVPIKCQICSHCFLGLGVNEDAQIELGRCKDMPGIAYLRGDADLVAVCAFDPWEACEFDDMDDGDVDECPESNEKGAYTWCPQWIQKREIARIEGGP